MHLKDHEIRAYLDGEAPRAGSHLASCNRCQIRLAEIRARSDALSARLSLLDPSPAESARPAASAIKKLNYKEHESMNRKPTLRPALTILAVLAVFAFAFSFQPVRALAGSFLNLFRVQQVTLLPLDMSTLEGTNGEPTLAQAIGQMFSETVNLRRPAEKPVEVETVAAASELAGFKVRSASDQQISRLLVDQGMAFDFTVDLEAARQVITDSGLQGPGLPDELDGVVVSVDIPANVSTSYGECLEDEYDPDDPESRARLTLSGCIHLLQMPSPTVQANPDVNIQRLAIIGLQYLDMTEAEAEAYSSAVDWATTLVIPVPRGEMVTEDVFVDGVAGKLLRSVSDNDLAIIWVKDGILHLVNGVVDSQTLLDFANSLR